MLESSTSKPGAQAALPVSSSPALMPSSRSHQQRHRPRDLSLNGVAKNRSQSAGSNWEAEFAQYSDAEQSRKASQHLELTWKVHKVPCLPQQAGSPSRLTAARSTDGTQTHYCLCCRMQSLPLAAIVKVWAMRLAHGVARQVRNLAYTLQMLHVQCLLLLLLRFAYDPCSVAESVGQVTLRHLCRSDADRRASILLNRLGVQALPYLQ